MRKEYLMHIKTDRIDKKDWISHKLGEMFYALMDDNFMEKTFKFFCKEEDNTHFALDLTDKCRRADGQYLFNGEFSSMETIFDYYKNNCKVIRLYCDIHPKTELEDSGMSKKFIWREMNENEF